MLLVRLLTGAGMEVREAANGVEAVEVYRSLWPDVIFMDIRMPVLDGYGATRQIREAEAREDPSVRRTVIIGLTASAFEQDREAVLAAGCDDFLPKPFRESALFELLERHAGMRFVREHVAETEPRVPGESVLTHLRMSTVPADLRARLKDCLDRGDLQGARETVEEIRAHDAPLAAALAESIRAYQIDRLLALVQSVAQ
jgi:two-component system sensor histidine kinase/response regulator